MNEKFEIKNYEMILFEHSIRFVTRFDSTLKFPDSQGYRLSRDETKEGRGRRGSHKQEWKGMRVNISKLHRFDCRAEEVLLKRKLLVRKIHFIDTHC